ncbi:MAG: lactoylglutathione lyase [Gammaproteobacteria bacterium]|nr:lactoylglutathione lyase [Gammaproteobacteria bacterium]
MNIKNNLPILPSRILYTMIRVGDLERAVTFYQDVLGMHEVRRETFTQGRFTLVFLAYKTEDCAANTSNSMIELTYNWDQDEYDHGNGYGHIALEVADIYSACEHFKSLGVKIIIQPGPMTYAVDETGHKEIIAFIEDPDGYKIELIQQ